jgi:hypothetical protein
VDDHLDADEEDITSEAGPIGDDEAGTINQAESILSDYLKRHCSPSESGHR